MIANAIASHRFHVDDDELGGDVLFELSRLARVDRDETHPLALRDGFGDGALLRRLTPIRRLRRALTSRNYRFVPDDVLSPLERLMPALQLLPIVRDKAIPYRRLGAAVAALVHRAPTVRFDDFGFCNTCIGSYTSHEGAHALFYEIACAEEGRLEGRRLVEVLLASEGFAIAFDIWVLLLALSDTRRSTTLFVALNTSASPFALAKYEKDAAGMLGSLARLAARRPAEVLTFLAAASLVANLRPSANAVKPELVRFLCTYAGLPETHLEEATCLVRMGLSVDADFRATTAPTFFRSFDLEPAFREISSAPLEHAFSPGSAFHDHLARAVDEVRPVPEGSSVLHPSAAAFLGMP